LTDIVIWRQEEDWPEDEDERQFWGVYSRDSKKPSYYSGGKKNEAYPKFHGNREERRSRSRKGGKPQPEKGKIKKEK